MYVLEYKEYAGLINSNWKVYDFKYTNILINKYTPPSILSKQQITFAVFKGTYKHRPSLLWTPHIKGSVSRSGREFEFRGPIRSLLASATPERRAPETRTDRNKRLQKDSDQNPSNVQKLLVPRLSQSLCPLQPHN